MRTLLLSCVALAASSAFAAESVQDRAKKTFKALPAQFDSKDNAVTPAKVELGKLLFFENRISKNHDLSCNSCHDVAKYGVDGTPTSTGHKKQLGGRNAPTVYNAGNHVAQFWDGRAPTLEEQAKGPVLNPIEMAMKDAAAVEAVLKSIPDYAPLFKKAFPDAKEPITYDNFAKAVGAFERTLVTPSRFDKFLGGDAKALTDAEQKGLAKFMDVGCIACHLGEGVGGGLYMKYGLVKPVAGLKDQGRFEVTKAEADKFVFRVPSLRNVEKTAPFMHDGSVKTLEEAVKLMGTHQLGKDLSKEDVDSLVTFLKSLTGELPTKAIAAPTLPKSGKATPKPDPS